jgi:hypothetical protein
VKVVDSSAKTVVILASGPSLTEEQITAARMSGFDTIVVNSTHEKMLDATMLYAGDFMWWKANVAKVRATFKGQRWTQDLTTSQRWPEIKRFRGATREGLGRDAIYTNGNSGVQAINLAYLLHYQRAILLGFDMKLGPKGEKHHHPDHPRPLVQGQTFDEWLKKLEVFAKGCREVKFDVINATPGSAMRCFPMADWSKVL